MRRRRLFSRFPLFAIYTAYVLISAVLKLSTLSNRGQYFYVYWFSEPGEVLLSILSVYESFIRVFGDFYRLVWFRILFPGTIILALSYSGWYAYAHPPIHANGWAAAIISGAVAAQYIILGISVLFFILVRLLNIRSRVYESRIVMGFGLASVVYAFSGVLRSEAGSHFQLLSQYLPAIGYVIATCIWLSAMLVREPWSDQGIPPGVDHDLLKQMRSQLDALRKVLGKNGPPPEHRR